MNTKVQYFNGDAADIVGAQITCNVKFRHVTGDVSTSI